MNSIIYLKDIKKEEILYIEYLKENNLYEVNLMRSYFTIKKEDFKYYFSILNLIKIRSYYINKENLKHVNEIIQEINNKNKLYFKTLYFSDGTEKYIRFMELNDEEINNIYI
jgi:hypothetical protein